MPVRTPACNERAATPTAPAWELSEVERQTMIAEAAYYRAAARGFAPGHELDDWLDAEAEIDARLDDRDADPTRM